MTETYRRMRSELVRAWGMWRKSKTVAEEEGGCGEKIGEDWEECREVVV